ncbi:MAG: sel1 repeat family protein [bacterium]|nr:sel1 repeat family protein [bacterium]
MRHFYSLFLLMLICSISLIAQDFEEQQILELVKTGNSWYEKERFEVAYEYFKSAAKKGNAEAERMVGTMLIQGKGVKQNTYLGLKWLKKAAKKKDIIAITNLGKHYYQAGEMSLAVNYLQTAAMQDNVEAISMVGKMYYEGKGVPRNLSLAIEWFKKASLQNHAYSEWQLGLIYTNGLGVTANFEEGLKWFQKSCDNGWESACVKVKKITNQ